MSVTFHLFDAITEDSGGNKEAETKDSYTIHLFGSTTEGKPIRLVVRGFEPFFYVELPSQKNAYTKFNEQLERALDAKRIYNLDIETRAIKKKPLYGYTGDTEQSVVELRVKSRRAFYDVRKLFLNDRSQPIFQLYRDDSPLKVYDAMLDPMLRFFHLRNLQPCGWVTAKVVLESEPEGLVGFCEWEDIHPCVVPPLPSAPFLINFWDIECYSESGDFPMANKGDPVIQIGNVFIQQGTLPEKHIFVLGSCDPVPGVTVHSYKTERDMILAWAGMMALKNPDILVGYNIFGFDERYIWDRAEQLGISHKPALQALNRLNHTEGNHPMKLVEKFLSSSALGDNYLHMWNTTGRLQIDLYHYIRRSASLPSYKLDDVCQFYMSGKCMGVQTNVRPSQWCIQTKQTGDVIPGRYVVLLDETGESITEKMKVVDVEYGKGVWVELEETIDEEDLKEAVQWAVVKDDCPPQEIFKKHKDGGSAGRAYVAKYCIQDCDLVHELYKKLDVFNNAMSMANVCSVPVNYIFTRGQGIKIESLIFKECHERDIIVEVLESQAFGASDTASDDDSLPKEDSYEGAIVLDPVPGFYSESPIGVCDFASLYPSTIISENISHDSLVWVKDFDLQGKLVGIPLGAVSDELNAPEGTRWTDIDFDIWRPDPNDKRKMPEKIKVGTRVCRYAQKADGSKHTLPDIVAKLLAARKAKRKEADKESDPFRKALLDAEQLAYKLTANSLYGQLGSATFKVRLVHLAASVTSYGRKQILFAKAAIETFYGPDAKDPRCCASITYGDTDSLFVDFGVKDPSTGVKLKGTPAVEATMHMTEEAGKLITGCLKPPHDFEYDKVFDQFIIFSKKRYVGNKYEESAKDFKQTSMGIVLKRRDNAPILKTIYGGAIKILLNERDVPKAAAFVKETCMDMVNGKTSLSQLTITKSLSARYKPDYIKMDIAELEEKTKKAQGEMEKLKKKAKKTESDTAEMKRIDSVLKEYTQRMQSKQDDLKRFQYPAHKILADRMRVRDPGNAPSSGERMGFVYITAPSGQHASKLQGERIETPDYIRLHTLHPDYRYYIEHQLMKPIGQLFSLMVDKIPGCTLSTKDLEGGSHRESLAIDLLFREAFARCDKQSLITTHIQSTTRKSPRLHNASNDTESATPPSAPSPSPSAPLLQKPTRQTTINSYFLHKKIAEEYKEQKEKMGKTLKEKDSKKK